MTLLSSRGNRYYFHSIPNPDITSNGRPDILSSLSEDWFLNRVKVEVQTGYCSLEDTTQQCGCWIHGRQIFQVIIFKMPFSKHFSVSTRNINSTNKSFHALRWRLKLKESHSFYYLYRYRNHLKPVWWVKTMKNVIHILSLGHINYK